MTSDLPLETSFFLFFRLYSQKIFFGYSSLHFPFSIFPLIFYSKLKDRFWIFSKFFIIFSLVDALTLVAKIKINKRITHFFIYSTSRFPT